MKDTEDFLTKMGGWVDKQLIQQKELEDFLKLYQINSLKEIKGIELQEKDESEEETEE